jgi:predicted transcriptional regulator of viral defense system
MNAKGKPRRSALGVELIRLLASEGDRVFSIDRARELSPRVGLSGSYLTQALFYLRENNWITPVRRGLYAIASNVPGVAPIHEFEIAMALVHPAAISHWSALHHHGLTEQSPHEVFVETTTERDVPRIRGTSLKETRYQVGEMSYRFIRLKPERFFGADKVWLGESRVMITDPERTLLDGLAMPQYCGDFAEVLHAFELRGRRWIWIVRLGTLNAWA